MPDDILLREPADRGVRRVALALLDDARDAAVDLIDAGDDKERDEALHDFRVAVRRLRSWLRAFRPWLGNAGSGKQRNRLRDIADATGPVRDAAVHLDWLRAERRRMHARQRRGEAWLREQLERRHDKGMTRALDAAKRFGTMAPKLERRLARYNCIVLPYEQSSLLGTVIAAQLREESDALREQLAAIHTADDEEEAHGARIAAKRLRYVFEPVAKSIVDGHAIVDTFKSLQDSLGDLHDVHVFSAELRSAIEDHADGATRDGLLHLAQRLDERGAIAYATVEGEWLHGASAPLFRGLSSLANDLATSCRGPSIVRQRT